MTAERGVDVAAVLAKHRLAIVAHAGVTCLCEDWGWGGRPWPEYYAHVAEQVTAWIHAQLATEETLDAVAEAVVLPDWCNEHGQERCDYVYHWPADEADLHRNGNFKSFTHRAEMLDAMRRQKRADAALAAVAERLGVAT